MNIKKASLVISITLLVMSAFCASAFAMGNSQSGIQFLPKLMYLIGNTTTNGVSTNTSRLLLDGGLGYKFTQPFYIGAQYGYDNSSTTTSSTTNNTYSGYGPTVGLMTDNVYLLFTYYVSSQYQNQAGSSTTTYTNGNGYQLDFAYLFSVGSKISLGPAISYRSLTYTTIQNPNGTSGSTNYNYVTLLPYLALDFSF